MPVDRRPWAKYDTAVIVPDTFGPWHVTAFAIILIGGFTLLLVTRVL